MLVDDVRKMVMVGVLYIVEECECCDVSIWILV